MWIAPNSWCKTGAHNSFIFNQTVNINSACLSAGHCSGNLGGPIRLSMSTRSCHSGRIVRKSLARGRSANKWPLGQPVLAPVSSTWLLGPSQFSGAHERFLRFESCPVALLFLRYPVCSFLSESTLSSSLHPVWCHNSCFKLCQTLQFPPGRWLGVGTGVVWENSHWAAPESEQLSLLYLFHVFYIIHWASSARFLCE